MIPQLKSVFDEHKGGTQVTVPFKAVEYARYYKTCLLLLDRLQEDPREWAKTSAEWNRWHQLAFARRGLSGKDVIMEDPELIDIDLS
jgi:hypothetical protein